MRVLCALLVSLTLTSPVITLAPAPDADWPQWRGPGRTGVAKEAGLLKSWPSNGPPLLWSISNLGEGYGSIAIKGDRIFVQGVKDRQSTVFCLSRSDGKTVWT